MAPLGSPGIIFKMTYLDEGAKSACIIFFTIKEIPDGFPCFDTFDPNSRDVARFEKSVK